MTTISFAGHTIGDGRPCFVVAEAGVNHNGDLALAHRLIDIAADARADAVKFQTFKAARLASAHAEKADYQRRGTSEGSQLEMLQALELSESAHRELKAHAEERGILFLSTPFDEEAADFLEGLGVALFKIPSGELTNLSFLAHVAKKGRPMLVSTGMATMREVAEAVDVIAPVPSVLLHCVSRYPAPSEDVNLRAMHTMATAFGLPVGYSDHTLGIEVAIAAVARGAVVIEKHFTSDRALAGPDHAASLEPHELSELIRSIRSVEQALGDGRKRPTAGEAAIARVARKSLVYARALSKGHRLMPGDVVLRRPGTGLPPGAKESVVGRMLARDVDEGDLVALEGLA
jgi:N,N'-diacetyllegionaminate synthase